MPALTSKQKSVIASALADQQVANALFTKLDGGEVPLTTTEIGAKNGSAVAATEQGSAVLHRTKLTLTDLAITTTDADTNGAHGSHKLYDFPEGHIHILSVHADLAVESTGATDGIATTATYDIGIGSTATATGDAALSTTEQNILTKQEGNLSSGEATIGAATASGVVLDGSATPADLYLNVAIEADDHDTEDGELTFNGTVTVLWTKLGDD